MATVIQFPAHDLAPGQCRAYQADGRTVLVYNLGGEFFATQGLCTHEDFPLEGGRFSENVIECPHHGARFNVTSGKVLSGPAEENLQTYPVQVVGEMVVVTVDDEIPHHKS